VTRRLEQARRLASVQTPVIPTVARWIASSPGTISFGQGVVSYPPPPEAIEAARRFGSAPADHRYGPVEGLPELIEAIEQKLAAENRIHVHPDSRVVVTAGSNMGFVNAVLAMLDDRDEVVLPAPYYFNHEMAIEMIGGRAVVVPARSDWQLDLDAIRAALTPRTRAIVTVSPNNPTGAVYPAADLTAVNELCRDRGLFHIHDEAYEYFTYGAAAHFSPGSLPGAGAHTISLHSCSKGFGMASWRVGYMTLPHILWDAVNKIQDTVLVCPPAISQHAAVAALGLGRSFAQPHIESLDRRRQTLHRLIHEADLPVDLTMPDGAFYFFIRVRANLDPVILVERLIREHRVAAMPGSAFGADGCTLRVSYGMLDDRELEDGAGRLIAGIRAIVGSDPGLTPV
jgi:aspartate/methionine/tyrosine aminotransferase